MAEVRAKRAIRDRARLRQRVRDVETDLDGIDTANGELGDVRDQIDRAFLTLSQLSKDVRPGADFKRRRELRFNRRDLGTTKAALLALEQRTGDVDEDEIFDAARDLCETLIELRCTYNGVEPIVEKPVIPPHSF